MNFRRMSAKYRWYRWKQDHKRELDFYMVCLVITVLLLIIMPFLFGSVGGSSAGSGIIDSFRYVPDQEK